MCRRALSNKWWYMWLPCKGSIAIRAILKSVQKIVANSVICKVSVVNWEKHLVKTNLTNHMLQMTSMETCDNFLSWKVLKLLILIIASCDFVSVHFLLLRIPFQSPFINFNSDDAQERSRARTEKEIMNL